MAHVPDPTALDANDTSWQSIAGHRSRAGVRLSIVRGAPQDTSPPPTAPGPTDADERQEPDVDAPGGIFEVEDFPHRRYSIRTSSGELSLMIELSETLFPVEYHGRILEWLERELVRPVDVQPRHLQLEQGGRTA